eukprot:5993313-Amphidinium_carterae.1
MGADFFTPAQLNFAGDNKACMRGGGRLKSQNASEKTVPSRYRMRRKTKAVMERCLKAAAWNIVICWICIRSEKRNWARKANPK